MIVDEIFCSIVVNPPNKQTVKPAKYSSKPKVYVLLQSLLGRFCPLGFMFHTTEVEIEEGWRLKNTLNFQTFSYQEQKPINRDWYKRKRHSLFITTMKLGLDHKHIRKVFNEVLNHRIKESVSLRLLFVTSVSLTHKLWLSIFYLQSLVCSFILLHCWMRHSSVLKTHRGCCKCWRAAV